MGVERNWENDEEWIEYMRKQEWSRVQKMYYERRKAICENRVIPSPKICTIMKEEILRKLVLKSKERKRIRGERNNTVNICAENLNTTVRVQNGKILKIVRRCRGWPDVVWLSGSCWLDAYLLSSSWFLESFNNTLGNRRVKVDDVGRMYGIRKPQGRTRGVTIR